MLVKGKSLRSVTRIKKAARSLTRVRFLLEVNSAIADDLSIAGFEDYTEAGYQLIPSQIGKITSFNVNGKEVKRVDLPMEPQPIEYFTKWKDWHGHEHSGIQTRMIDMYPREYIEAPEERLTMLLNQLTMFVTPKHKAF